MTQSDSFEITLKLGGQSFHMTIPREEEIFYRNAEKRINNRYSYYVNQYPTVSDPKQYLLMTVLEIAVALEKSTVSGNLTPIMATLNGLINEMDAALR